MAKAYLVSGIDGNVLMQGIVTDNELYKFGVGGKYVGSGPISYNIQMKKEIDILSIINVENELEIAYILNNDFKKFQLNLEIPEVASVLNKLKDILFVGRISNKLIDTQGEICYNQYIYGFEKGKIDEIRLRKELKING